MRPSGGVRRRLAVLGRMTASTVVAAVLATACGSGVANKPGDDPVLRPTTTARPASGGGY